MTGPLTLELRREITPELLDILDALGHDLTIVYTPADSSWGSISGEGGLSIPVRGLLMPAERRSQQAAAGAELEVPQFEAYVPFSVADLSVPGWHVLHEGQRYYPTADARDEGGQGIVWVLELGGPGEVSASEPIPPTTGWAG